MGTVVAASAVGALLSSLLGMYLWVLIGRIVIDYAMMFSRSWQPRGVLLALVDVVFRLTDPPLTALRRVVPPLRLGQISFDLGFLILFFGVQILGGIVRQL